MQDKTSVGSSLADGIVDHVESLLEKAETAAKPLELEPFRSRLFEVFVTAEAAGYIADEAETDLSAEGLCGALSKRWGLADATREAFEQQTKLPPDQLARMRLLWSMMRMWMEWTYAWKRWPEFHTEESKS